MVNRKQGTNGSSTLSMKRIVIVTIIACMLGAGIVVVKYVDGLNDSIQFKQIEIQDNSVKLKVLNTKYKELNSQLDKTGADKVKLEAQLKQLEEEKNSLQSQLITKQQQKSKYTISATAYAGSGDAKAFIYSKESGGRLIARNSIGCLGLGQACPGSKLINACPDWETNYACQDAFFTNYMLNRYGSWDNARSFWLANRWW
jgi:hypothetical protein